MSFQPYAQRCKVGNSCCRTCGFDRPPILHLGFKRCRPFGRNGALPHPGYGSRQGRVDRCKLDQDKILRTMPPSVFSCTWRQDREPVLVHMCRPRRHGGTSAQGVQWQVYSINGFSILMPTKPARYYVQDAALLAPRNSRYDESDCRLGKERRERLLDLQYFIIGAGAIGCEMLKNYSLMGVGCGPPGRLRDGHGLKSPICRDSFSSQFRH
jgi:ubiquitin-activating enzyme E1